MNYIVLYTQQEITIFVIVMRIFLYYLHRNLRYNGRYEPLRGDRDNNVLSELNCLEETVK